LQPRVGPFDDPSVPAALQFASVLMSGSWIVAPRRNDWLNAAFNEELSSAIAATSATCDQAFWLFGKPVSVDKRRCAVLGLPYRSGSSFQEAAVYKIHRMPSKH
jgi:hypothetical protein